MQYSFESCLNFGSVKQSAFGLSSESESLFVPACATETVSAFASKSATGSWTMLGLVIASAMGSEFVSD